MICRPFAIGGGPGGPHAMRGESLGVVARTAVTIAVLAATVRSVEAQEPERVAAAIEAARRGGTVIACRHGVTDHRQRENEMTLRYDDPTTQRRMTTEGERHAASVGAALRTLGVRVTEVTASPMERAWRTAELMFGTPTRDSTWFTRGDKPTTEQLEARRRAVATPVATGNRAIVSHLVTLQSVLTTTGSLEEGDCIVARPTGTGHEVIGQVPWRAWIDAAAAPRR